MMELVVVHTRSKESNDYSPYKEKRNLTQSLSIQVPFLLLLLSSSEICLIWGLGAY